MSKDGKLTPARHWSMAAAIEQIDKHGFECEGGPLSMCDAWIWLKGAAEVGPKFWPGQGVWFEVQAAVNGVEVRQWGHFYIVGCHMDSDTERRFFTYDLSNDPPAPYHYGTVQFSAVPGSKLRLTNPEKEEAA